MSISHNNGRDKAGARQTARHKAQMWGGEIEDYLEAPAYKEWDDKKLTQAGFVNTAIYDYPALNGHVLYQVLRYEHRHVKGEKRFIQRMPSGETVSDVAWFANAGYVKVVYRWPEVAQRADEPVHLAEGEKDADKLRSLGLLGTTVAGQNWSSSCAQALLNRSTPHCQGKTPQARPRAAGSSVKYPRTSQGSDGP